MLKKALELLIVVTKYQLHLGALVIALTSGVPAVASERASEISVSCSLVVFVQILHNIPNRLFRRIGGCKRAVAAAGYHGNDKRLGDMG